MATTAKKSTTPATGAISIADLTKQNLGSVILAGVVIWILLLDRPKIAFWVLGIILLGLVLLHWSELSGYLTTASN